MPPEKRMNAKRALRVIFGLTLAHTLRSPCLPSPPRNRLLPQKRSQTYPEFGR